MLSTNSKHFQRWNNVFSLQGKSSSIWNKHRGRRCPYISHLTYDCVLLVVYCLTFHSELFNSYGDVTVRGESCKFRPRLGTYSLWKRRYLYRVTSAVTLNLGFCGLIQKTAQFSRLVKLTRPFRSNSIPNPNWATILAGWYIFDNGNVYKLQILFSFTTLLY